MGEDYVLALPCGVVTFEGFAESVRDGRLARGLGRVSTGDEREFFESRLRKIIRREGYDTW